MREEPKHPQPVVEADHQHALLRQVPGVLARLGRGPRDKAATVDPDHHRQQFGLRMIFRHPQVKIQAIFAGPVVVEDHVIEDASLHGARPVVNGAANTGPRRGRLRRLPAQRADRRRSIRNSLERAYLVVGADHAFQHSIHSAHLHGAQLLRVHGMHSEQQRKPHGPYLSMKLHNVSSDVLFVS